jgi:hypothetical protein
MDRDRLANILSEMKMKSPPKISLTNYVTLSDLTNNENVN